MHVTIVPCRRDNYAYVLGLPGQDEVLVVDPSDAEPVLSVVERAGQRVAAVLNTHHHHDHVGGNERLLQRFPEMRVYGHASDRGRIPVQTEFLEDGQRFECASMQFEVLHIPGHTLGAIAYVAPGVAFTGDTLFGAGCGRLFEGTAAMMYESLNVKLSRLPDDTQLYFGHEYTAGNLRFALHVEPNNVAVQQRARTVAEKRQSGQATAPSTLGVERATNPFLRCDSAEVAASVAARLGADTSPVAVFAALRAAKDAF